MIPPPSPPGGTGGPPPPLGPPGGSDSPTPKGRNWKKIGLIGGGVFVALLVVAAIAGPSEEETGNITKKSTTTTEAISPRAKAIKEGNVALCNDGGYSDNTDFSATCSGGDGIDEWLAPYGECKDGSVIKMSEDASCEDNGGFKRLLPPDYAPKAGKGDVAQCEDGTFSDNTDFSATCSSRGGVKKWLAPYGKCKDGKLIKMSKSASCDGHEGFRGLLPVDFVPPTTTTTAAPTTTAPAPTTTAPPPQPVVIEGQGDDVIQISQPDGSAPTLVYAKHTGSSNFVLQSSSELLVNEIGNYEGVTLTEDAGSLQVTADGPWRIEFRSIRSAQPYAGPKTDGRGDNVLLYNGPSGVGAFSHAGESNFVVDEYGGNGLLVNEIGNYTGRVPISEGPVLLVISADGNWSVAVTDS